VLAVNFEPASSATVPGSRSTRARPSAARAATDGRRRSRRSSERHVDQLLDTYAYVEKHDDRDLERVAARRNYDVTFACGDPLYTGNHAWSSTASSS